MKRILNWFSEEWRKLLLELDKTKKIKLKLKKPIKNNASNEEDSEGCLFYILSLFLALIVISIFVYFFYQYMYANPDLYPGLQKGYEVFAVMMISFWAIPLASIVPYSMETDNRIEKLFGYLFAIASICLMTFLFWL
tara:strand:- start:58 stop:468 length:411 start_codon:yes stop_codon:yes gene_type:complete